MGFLATLRRHQRTLTLGAVLLLGLGNLAFFHRRTPPPPPGIATPPSPGMDTPPTTLGWATPSPRLPASQGVVSPSAEALSPTRVSRENAQEVVSCLAQFIVLEYTEESVMSDSQLDKAHRIFDGYAQGQGEAKELPSAWMAVLSDAQHTYLQQRDKEVKSKLSELLDLSRPTQTTYCALFLDLLKEPIRPDP